MFARFAPVSGRYIQLRQGPIKGTTYFYGCVANLYVMTSEDAMSSLDFTLLSTLYAKGLVLLKTLDKSTMRYRTLQTALETAKATLADESLLDFPLVGQTTIDTAAATLMALLDSFDPPRQPPALYAPTRGGGKMKH
ncbi:MAG: hypothetical protein LBR16_04760 [Treponema sp.]|nr:hypothetical protein [Treponema sp.]